MVVAIIAIVILAITFNTPVTRGDSGFRDQTLAEKVEKTSEIQLFFNKK